MDLKAAKAELREKSRPYQTYSYYLIIPIFIILVFLLSFQDCSARQFTRCLLVHGLRQHYPAGQFQ